MQIAKLALFILMPGLAFTQAFREVLSIDRYGWLDEFSVNDRHSFGVGDEACVPTSSVNAMTYLQNTAPHVFQQSLTGGDYDGWVLADDILINLMGTTISNGTFDFNFASGWNEYITQIRDYSDVQVSGMFTRADWNGSLYGLNENNPAPPYIQLASPNASFLTNAVAAGSAIVATINYLSGGGHGVVVNGFAWDTDTNTGTLYFVDPLDPSQNYSSSNPSAVEGPAKQTVGTLTLRDDGRMQLQYSQYQGNLDPYDPAHYAEVDATIDGLFAVGGSATATFSDLLPPGNTRRLAVAFGDLDPTTSEMFEVLAVLNTLADPSPDFALAFDQMDPSPFNATLFVEQSVARQVQAMVDDHLLSYLRLCALSCCESQPKNSIWATPFLAQTNQRGQIGSYSHSAYKSPMSGVVLGGEHRFENNVILGAAGAYANNQMKWTTAKAHAHIDSWEGLVYTSWVECPWWLKGNIGYSFNSLGARRTLFAATDNPFIPPINETFSHRINSSLFTTDLGFGYDVYEKKWNCSAIQLWPYFDFNYEYVHQPAYTEKGGEPLALHVMKKSSHLLLPSVGLGFNGFKEFKKVNLSGYVAAAYTREIRINGRNTTAYFIHNPDSQFTVSGMLPQNNLFCPTAQLSLASSCYGFQFHLTYQGAYGAKFTANSGAAEFAVSF